MIIEMVLENDPKVICFGVIVNEFFEADKLDLALWILEEVKVLVSIDTLNLGQSV